jgi:lipase
MGDHDPYSDDTAALSGVETSRGQGRDLDEKRLVTVNGIDLALWERPGRPPIVLLCHATGFHARCWDAGVGMLAGLHTIAIDMRGHGQSSKPEPPIPWRRFGEDVAAVARELGLRGAIAVGHSMGGHSVTLAAALMPEAFSHLILFDPVIMPEPAYTGAYSEPHFARKRRNRWASPAAMFENFRNRQPFSAWDLRVLRDYCEFGLVPAPDGDGFVLACPPEIEGSIYEQSRARDANIYPEIARVNVPVRIVRSHIAYRPNPPMNMLASPTSPGLYTHFAHASDQVVNHSHFIPMEAPALVAAEVLAAVTRPDSA